MPQRQLRSNVRPKSLDILWTSNSMSATSDTQNTWNKICCVWKEIGFSVCFVRIQVTSVCLILDCHAVCFEEDERLPYVGRFNTWVRAPFFSREYLHLKWQVELTVSCGLVIYSFFLLWLNYNPAFLIRTTPASSSLGIQLTHLRKWCICDVL